MEPPAKQKKKKPLCWEVSREEKSTFLFEISLTVWIREKIIFLLPVPLYFPSTFCIAFCKHSKSCVTFQTLYCPAD